MNDLEYLGINNGSPVAQWGLKTPLNSSHNQDEEERIIALVKLLARRAAEEDFEMHQNAPNNHLDTLH